MPVARAALRTDQCVPWVGVLSKTVSDKGHNEVVKLLKAHGANE